MSLRLDPKYHGVRVANVRPKVSAMSNVEKPDTKRVFAEIKVNKSSSFRFVRFTNGYWEPRYIAAYVEYTPYYTIKSALKAIGLR